MTETPRARGHADKGLDTDWLAANPPTEDAGARTQSAYRFQHECTARLCAPMFVKERVLAVICEEHEDCIVFFEEDVPQLVSVKHREGSRGPWSFKGLLTSGGIRHLHDRWLNTGKNAQCMLMTNGSLKTGNDEATEFVSACHSRDPKVCEVWASRIATEFDISSEEATTYLSRLSIEADLPDRDTIGAVNVRDLVIPAMQRLGLDQAVAQAVYDRLLEAIARANRDAVGDPMDLLDVVADPGRLNRATETDGRLRRRRIDRAHAAALLTPPATGVTQLTPQGDTPPPPPPSRLQQKLVRGGLGQTALRTAIRLRASWYAFERSRRMNVPGGDSAFDDLRLRVQELVALSESRTKSDGEYGPSMHVDVRDNVTVTALPGSPLFPIDDQLLQGLVFQLTDECEVWWSKPFKIEDRRDR